MATVVIGTAGHIDHGKTTLLRALTGIDADRLPEERARGMTIDVGFAHVELADGTSIDFVDVPGHDRLVGNMLVGAGEIDGVILVVAADDGPRAQTLEHLELLDALGLTRAVVAVTKVDVAGPVRATEVAAAIRAIVDRTGMAGAPIVEVSGVTGEGVDALRGRLVALRDAILADGAAGAADGAAGAADGSVAGPTRLPIDRAFAVRGRGAVVTGTLAGGVVRAGDTLRLEPGGTAAIRIREVQVHHGPVAAAAGGRTALNLAAIDTADLRRGQVLTTGPGVDGTDRLLLAIRPPTPLLAGEPVAPWPPRPSASLRLHLWTDAVDAVLRPTGARWVEIGDHGLAALAHLPRPVAALLGARAVLRDPGSGEVVAGAVVLDTQPARGTSRRRATPARLAGLAAAATSRPGDAAAALLDLHGAWRTGSSGLALAADVRDALAAAAVGSAPARPPVAEVRSALLRQLRRLASLDRGADGAARAAIDALLDELVASGRLGRDADRIVDPGSQPAVRAELAAAMGRLEAALDVPIPPPLADAAREAGCPPEGVRLLESSGRIVRVDDDLAWSAGRYAALRDIALDLARQGPLAPAAFRDAIGGNRRVCLALLEDLGRRGLLRRTDAGHVLGARAEGRSSGTAGPR